MIEDNPTPFVVQVGEWELKVFVTEKRIDNMLVEVYVELDEHYEGEFVRSIAHLVSVPETWLRAEAVIGMVIKQWLEGYYDLPADE